MKVEFTITFMDYKDALKLHRRKKFSRRIFPWIWPSLFLMSVIAFIAASVNKNLAVASQAVAVAVGSFFAMVALPILRFVKARQCYKQMYPPTRTSMISTIEIDDQMIVETNPGTEEVRLPWSGVLDFAQDGKVTLIYISTLRFFLLPASAMSEAQRAELNDLVACHVMKRS